MASAALRTALGAAATLTAYRLASALSRRVSFDGARVLILGGNRGLGLEIARALASDGARLALVGRTESQLDTAAAELRGRGAEVHIRAADLMPEGAAADAVAWAVDAMGGLDALVYVAGIIAVSPLEHLTRQDDEVAMAIHYWAPREALLAALPHLERSEVARVAVISSIAGRVASPHLISYTSSKFALSGLADGLRTPFRRRGVHLTTVNPGLMRTGSPRNAAFKGDAAKEYGWFAPRVGTPLSSIDSGRAARQIVDAMRHGRARLTITAQARLLHLVDTVFPELAADAMELMERHYLPAPVGPEGDRLVMGHDGPEQAAEGRWTKTLAEAAARNNETDAAPPYPPQG